MRNAGLEEAQAGIKIAGRNINNLRYADDTTLKAESEEELKSLLMKVKEESEKVGLKLNIRKLRSWYLVPITSWQIDGETVETMTDFIFLGSKITVDGDCSHEMKKCLNLGKKVMTTLVQFSSVAQSCPTLCDPMNRSAPGLPVHHQLLGFTQTHVHQVSDAILCRPLLLLPPIPPSIRVFSSESTLHMRWPKYWSFSFSIIPSKEIPGLSPSEWTGWISLQSKGLSRVFSNTTVQKH